VIVDNKNMTSLGQIASEQGDFFIYGKMVRKIAPYGIRNFRGKI
jgi:hypothetical protein